MRKKISTAKGSKKQSANRRAGPAAAAVGEKRKRPAKPITIIGLGASAGGLEALEEFFSHTPPNTGMAFLVVTHQHPGHVSLLPELLGKHTRMPVREARNGQRIEPNCVYVSSPNRRLALFNGTLQLTEFKEHDGLKLPIDFFLRSLAEDQRERAIGIILSGTGTDGTLGLKAIKGAGGMTMVQEPESAKYSGMPASAVTTGMIDYVLRPEQMPERLAAYSQGPYLLPAEPAHPAESTLPEAMQKILLLLRSRNGHDLLAYKPTTIRRRIERRMNIHQIKNPEEYARFLEQNPHELDLLFKELFIGVTSFFRDPEAFAALSREALPALLQGKPDDAAVRVWVPGCSTGEEAYSLAMVLRESLDKLKKRLAVQIFATDLDVEAIEIARSGLYPDGIAMDVPPAQLARHFVREEGSYRIKKGIRELVVFAPHNVLKDPLFTKLDVIACRNLLIYLKPEVQKRLLALFHYALRPNGLLFLGPSESVGEFSHAFAAVDKKWKIFARKQTSLALQPLADFRALPATADAHALPAAAPLPAHEPQGAAMLEKMLVQRFVPASVIINARGDISYIHGRTGDYLEPAAGQPRLNVLEMAREGLRPELAAAIRRAVTSDEEVIQQTAKVKSNGGFKAVSLTITRLNEPEPVRGLLLVTFRPASASRPPAKMKRAPLKTRAGRMEELEQELQFTRESLQSTVEELQSSNEELQSTNEELQSTNEELETSKEEMQSLNEELQTVNAQLQSKVDALSETSDDMQNLLNSTAIATIFLDQHLKIKQFTEQARTVINLIPSDAGRPIGDLVSNLNYDQLAGDAAEVLKTLNYKEREVKTKQGGWRLVRILPYRTRENVIDGLVLAFIDINRLKEAELAAQKAKLFAENIVATVREPMVVLDTGMRVVMASQSFYHFFRVTRAEVEGRPLYELGNGQWNIPRLRQLLEKILPRNNSFDGFKVAHVFPRVGRRALLLNARRLKEKGSENGMILLAMEAATEKRRGAGRGRKGR